MSDAIIILGTFTLVLFFVAVVLYDVVLGEGRLPGSRDSVLVAVAWYILACLLGSGVLLAVLVHVLGT